MQKPHTSINYEVTIKNRFLKMYKQKSKIMVRFALWIPIFVVIGFLTFSPVFAEKIEEMHTTTFPPVDESASVPSFAIFWKNFKRTCENRDVESLEKCVDKNIRCGFGGEDGIQNFIKQWNLDKNPGNSKIWGVLLNIIRQGGVFDEKKTNFRAPTIFFRPPKWPFGQDNWGLVTAENVNIRDTPSTKGKLVDKITYDFVKISFLKEDTIDGETFPWYEVVTQKGQKGAIWGKFISTGYEHRLEFEKIGDNWLLTFLLSGD
ncbi:MAG: SH3 domain-containing protein [Candidatus Riflebacteria bacterium]|nr:SH3 domain-containing protein [Candidatus Riflebacteria bacterium]